MKVQGLMHCVRSIVSMAAVALALVLTSATAAALPATHERGGPGVLAWSRFDNSPDNTARIVRGQPLGGRVAPLTHPATGTTDIDPKISPDGRAVLFERDPLGQNSVAGVVGIDGRGERILPLDCSGACAGIATPVWTRDGRHVVFTRVIGPFDQANNSARSAVLWTSDLDGSHLKRLSEPGIDGAYEDYDASFAPAGYVVFVRVRNTDVHNAVFRMNPDGTDVRQLTVWSLSADLPSVSQATSGPTRDTVVFETYGHGAPPGLTQQVATVRATCGTLADCTARIRYLTSSARLTDQNFNPAWSPDGRHIVYVHFSFVDPGPPVGDIWTMRFDGKGKSPVSTDPRFEFRPSWGLEVEP